MSEGTPENPTQGDPNQSDTPQAPQPAEPKPVQVSPADQSEPKRETILGKDYEVTKDGGYRQVQEQQSSSGDSSNDVG